MFKFMSFFLFAVIFAMAYAKPTVYYSPYTAEVVGSPVLSTSSQYVARNYNGYASYVAEAPVVSSLPYTSLGYPYASYVL
ncbi:unnamed protein product [Chironomus riparius]|uniref:Cuticle protein n=1 Tax=Chironomus riparius TaxID=315576 RepID=A0A9N9RNF9_9DIPT|nr:unnamed protein product [Chironomus riparius]